MGLWATLNQTMESAFRIETAHTFIPDGAQVLGAMQPEQAPGQEPVSGQHVAHTLRKTPTSEKYNGILTGNYKMKVYI